MLDCGMHMGYNDDVSDLTYTITSVVWETEAG